MTQFAHILAPGTTNDGNVQPLIERASKEDLDAFLRNGGNEHFLTLFDNPQIRFILDYKGERVGEEHLEQAVSVLSSLNFVGLCERLEPAMIRIFQDLGIPTRPRVGRLNTNPLRQFDLELADRATLEAVTARSTYDGKLFDYFVRRGSAYPAAYTSASRQKIAADTAEVSNESHGTVAIYDLARTANIALSQVVAGEQFQILGDDILLHPPAKNNGSASLLIRGFNLNGEDTIGVTLVLDEKSASPVTFSISFGSDMDPPEEWRAQSSVTCSASQAITTELTFPPIFGRTRVRLSTTLADGYEDHSYAWAVFRRAVFFRSASC
jgi:hypothetical protein